MILYFGLGSAVMLSNLNSYCPLINIILYNNKTYLLASLLGLQLLLACPSVEANQLLEEFPYIKTNIYYGIPIALIITNIVTEHNRIYVTFN